MKVSSILLFIALAASPLAGAAPADLPERVARLAYVEGQISFQEAGEPPRWTLPDRALLPDDRLTTKPDSRADIALGTAAVRLDERTTIEFETLDADRVRLKLEEGIAVVTLRELAEGESFEVTTSNTTFTLFASGEYRLEVPVEGVSAITVHGGDAQAETAGGPVRIADGQRVRLEGPQALATLETARPADAFDEWVLQREVQLAENAPSGNMEEPVLDRYGEWQDDSTYGRVWVPASAYGGYDPFGYGTWRYIGFGRSWVDPYPWSPYTFHSGRWVYLHHMNRWCWTPPQNEPRPAHRPETHPFGRPQDRPRKVAPIDRDAPDIFANALSSTGQSEPLQGAAPQSPRVTSSRPRSGTFIPVAPRISNLPRHETADGGSSSSGGGAMRPSSGSSSSTPRPSSSSSRPSTMSTGPSRASSKIIQP